MNEDLAQVSHCVYSTDTGLAIWWVDDCFTNPTKDGGYLPIENVRSKTVDPLVHGNSGEIYKMLLELAHEEGLSFFVCSFEYAEANWELKLNRFKNIVLIDIGYEGKPEESTYGLNLLFEMNKKNSLVASVAFLTINAQRVTDWIISTGNWLPKMSVPIEKSRFAPSDIIATTPDEEVKALIQFFKQQQIQEAAKCQE